MGFARALEGTGVEFATASLDPLGRVDAMACHVMDEIGIDIRGLQGRALGREAVQRADLIVLLSGQDERLGPLLGTEKTVRWFIDDPLGWPRDIYEDIRDEIGAKVHELLEWVAWEREEALAPETASRAYLALAAT
jgi:protein-tyrosine-phosphatase